VDRGSADSKGVRADLKGSIGGEEGIVRPGMGSGAGEMVPAGDLQLTQKCSWEVWPCQYRLVTHRYFVRMGLVSIASGGKSENGLCVPPASEGLSPITGAGSPGKR
jgi:hypothetical protein